MNDIRSISRPIHAPSHELEATDTITPPTKVISIAYAVQIGLLTCNENTVK
jgi:hypothetical protein